MNRLSNRSISNVFRSLIIGSIIILSACGGSDSDDNNDIDSSNSNTAESSLSRNSPFTGQAQLGPLVNATVELHPIDQLDKSAIYTAQTTDSDDLTHAGLFAIPNDLIDDQGIYLISVSGGEDIDVDDDGVLDALRTTNSGTVHSIITGAQIKTGDFSVSIVTEVAYQNSLYLLATNVTHEALKNNIDVLARHLIKQDITEDGTIAAEDLLAWQPVSHQSALTHSYSRYRSLIDDIHAGREVLYNALPFISFEIAHVDWPSPQAVAIKDQYALLAHPQDGLGIVDISDPKHPVIVETISQHEDGQDIALLNNKAYVAVGVDREEKPGLAIWDVNNPEQAALSAFIDAPFKEQYQRDCVTSADGETKTCELEMLEAQKVAITDQYAYVTYNSRVLFEQIEVELDDLDSTEPTSGLQVVDIQTQQQVSFLPLTQADDIVITEDGLTAYVIDNNEVVRLNTHGDGTVEIAEQTGINSNQMALVNGHLFLYAYGGDLNIYSLPLLSGSTPISSLSLSSENYADSIEVVGHSAYIGIAGAVKVVDISDLTNPYYKASVTARGPGILGIASSDGYLYTANHNDGLVISDLHAIHADENYQEDFPAVTNNLPQNSTALASEGNYLYVSNDALSAYAITDDGGLELASTHDFESLDNIKIIDQQLITTSDNLHLSTFSLADPSLPVELGSTIDVDDSPLPVYSKGLAVLDQYAYVSTTGYDSGDIAIQVYDLSAGNENTQVNSILPNESDTWLTCAAINGHYLYAIGYRRLEILDLSADPLNPINMDTIDFPLCEEIIISGSTAYVAAGSDGVFIYDVTDPLTPKELSHLETTGVAGGIFLLDSHLYIGSFNSVLVADISNLQKPKLIAAARTPGEPSKLLVSKDQVYVLDGSNGITVLHALK